MTIFSAAAAAAGLLEAVAALEDVFLPDASDGAPARLAVPVDDLLAGAADDAELEELDDDIDEDLERAREAADGAAAATIVGISAFLLPAGDADAAVGGAAANTPVGDLFAAAVAAAAVVADAAEGAALELCFSCRDSAASATRACLRRLTLAASL